MARPGYATLLDLRGWAPPPVAFFSSAEQDRAARLHPPDRLRFLAGRFLLREILARELVLAEPSAVPLEISPLGKPFCPLPEAPAFNLSHTAAAAVLALSFAGPVGVDLEDSQRTVAAAALARRWFHPEEFERFLAEGPASFFRYWTRKEACLKATGEGLRGDWSRINTLAMERAGDWTFTESAPAENLRLCIVAREPIAWAWTESPFVG